MKKILILLLSLAMVLSLAACGKPAEESTEEPAPVSEPGTEATQPTETLPESTAEETQPTEPETEPPKREAFELLDKEEFLAFDTMKIRPSETYDGKADGYTFRVGAGKAVITPQIGERLTGYATSRNAESVNDDLNIIFFAFEQNGKVILWGYADLCNTGNMFEEFRKLMAEETGLAEEDIFLCTTHTHSGPSMMNNAAYLDEIFYPAARQAAAQALEDLQWAEMGISTIESMVGVNRRLPDSGMISLKAYPDGAYDPTMTVISFRNHEGKTIGNLIHYGAHGTAFGQNTAISRDWCGYMKDALEAENGGITAFMNGALGNVAPRISSGDAYGNKKVEMVESIGSIAAKDATDCYKTITEWKKDCKLNILRGTISIPFLNATLEEIEAEYNKIKDTIFPNAEERDHISGLKAYVELLQSGKTFEAYTTEASLIALGDVCFLQNPFENFAEMILDIREASPFQYTLIVSKSGPNDGGYFITEEEIPKGGYESRQYWQRTVDFGTPWLIENGTDIYADAAVKLMNILAAKN